ncbi:hypothetical protein OBBRIDRAFT_789997 [Obba rivulosa]|uniref:Uncharacterized protein n=1 Tax=Obba rivulosa TaxID=1052685 RepID=A0A8E2J329_9APHY|nr:hypothetical protein OBBRIDRAFT_789997 [Obba rivulosa]
MFLHLIPASRRHLADNAHATRRSRNFVALYESEYNLDQILERSFVTGSPRIHEAVVSTSTTSLSHSNIFSTMCGLTKYLALLILVALVASAPMFPIKRDALPHVCESNEESAGPDVIGDCF